MKNKEIEYGFWFWKNKLLGVLVMLASLANYDLNEDEIEVVKQKLRHSNNEKDEWAEYLMDGKVFSISMKLAYDSEDLDIIHIQIKASQDLEEKLEALDLFQSIFEKLELKNNER